MRKYSALSKPSQQSNVIRHLVIIVPLIVAGAFSFGYTYYKQLNYNNSQAAYQAKNPEFSSSGSLPLASSSSGFASPLSVEAPIQSTPITSSLSTDQQTPTTSSPETASLTPLQNAVNAYRQGEASEPLQANTKINDPRLVNNPWIIELLNRP